MGRKYTLSKLMREYPHLRGGAVVEAQAIHRLDAELARAGPRERLRILERADTIALLGAAQCAQRRRPLEKRLRRLGSIVCSATWLDASWERGEEFPPGDFALRGMVLSRCGTRIGMECIPTRRWTPSNAVAVEDGLDELDCLEAMRYRHPASPSAVVIGQIGMRKGTERLIRLREKRDAAERQKQAERDRALTLIIGEKGDASDHISTI